MTGFTTGFNPQNSSLSSFFALEASACELLPVDEHASLVGKIWKRFPSELHFRPRTRGQELSCRICTRKAVEAILWHLQKGKMMNTSFGGSASLINVYTRVFFHITVEQNKI